MIKKTKNNTRQQLLRKNSNQSVQISEMPPFQIQECYSAVGYDERQFSYYCLENEQGTAKGMINPYCIQMSERSFSNGNDKIQSNKIKEKKQMLPQKITMNGNCYQKVGLKPQPQKQVIEQVKAICGSCKTFQLIPKNSSKFICYSCRTICKCVSRYNEAKVQKELKQPTVQKTQKAKIFKCGNCFVKVSYQPGVSQYIRCTKCNTINAVSN